MRKKINKIFKVCYFINLIIIAGILIYPLISMIISNEKDSFELFILQIYAFAILLAFTFCITFLGLNIWGVFINYKYRIIHILVIVIMLIWILWGIYQYHHGVLP